MSRSRSSSMHRRSRFPLVGFHFDPTSRQIPHTNSKPAEMLSDHQKLYSKRASVFHVCSFTSSSPSRVATYVRSTTCGSGEERKEKEAYGGMKTVRFFDTAYFPFFLSVAHVEHTQVQGNVSSLSFPRSRSPVLAGQDYDCVLMKAGFARDHHSGFTVDPPEQ